MQLTDFDYDLPPELIAQTPVEPRDSARLMVIERNTNQIRHHRFADLPDLLRPSDCLVMNDTRVLPARLRGYRQATGGKWEGLFVGESAGFIELMAQTRGKPVAGETIVLEPSGEQITLASRTPSGGWLAKRDPTEPIPIWLERVGEIPLPPYIRDGHASHSDRERYQTVYAHNAGSVAAPTAGLHFTDDLLQKLERREITRAFVTLHIGRGTFLPVQSENLSEHVMHHEWYCLPEKTADQLKLNASRGGRTVAVGTTVVRTLESVYAKLGDLSPSVGTTDLFIRPGFSFGVVDALVTNFHLPKSTLLMLVSALAGVELIREAYRIAVADRYRFFSYGDAMLII